MKSSNNTFAALLFLIIASLVFVMMARRPVVEGNVLNFGMPLSNQAEVVTKPDQPAEMDEQQKPTESTTEVISETLETETDNNEAPPVNDTSSTETMTEGGTTNSEESTEQSSSTSTEPQSN